MTKTIDFIVNVNDGEDVIHVNPTLEICNADQIEGRKHVDARTAAAMIAKGQARACEHCSPEPHGRGE